MTDLVIKGRRVCITEEQVRQSFAEEGLPVLQLPLGDLDESFSIMKQVVDVPENWTGLA